jgi:asparagine synthase (glutamine-hydrolysing)
MPGIFGLTVHESSSTLASSLESMAEPMRRHSWYTHEQWVDSGHSVGLGRVSLGIVNSAPQPATNEDRTLHCVMDGELLDYHRHRRSLEAAGHRLSSDSHAEILLHGFETHGSRFFAGVVGKFAAAIWDSRQRRLILVNDRFGMKPVYYSQLPDQFRFGSSIQSLLIDGDVNRQHDPRGLAQFFTFGHMLGEDTLLQGVKLLPAAGCLTYSVEREQATLERYWQLPAQPTNRNRAEVLDRIDNAFGAAVNRCCQDTEGLGLSLSGGMDARTILALAAQLNRSVTTVTLGMPGSIDQRTAAQLANLAGCPNHHVLLDQKFLSEYETHLNNMVSLTDGQYLCQCIVMPTLPIYRELGIRVLLRGHAGELMHMNKAYNFSLDRAAMTIADDAQLLSWTWRHLQSYMLDDVNGRLFVGISQADTAALAQESLRDCLQSTNPSLAPVQRIAQLFLSQRSRRETALSLVEFDSVVETRLPYMDNELIDALFSAPPEMKIGEEIQTHILRRHRPEFLRVVNANTGTRVGTSQWRRSVAKLRSRILAKLGVPGYQPYERLGLWLRRELRPLVRCVLLSDRCLTRGIFDPQTVRGIVEAHLAGRRNHTYLILAMMIFETAQLKFHDGGRSDVGLLSTAGAA